jgi:hypothetical protein
VDLGAVIAVQLNTTRTSTCVGGAEGADTDNANRSPSCTRGGTTRRTGWRPRPRRCPRMFRRDQTRSRRAPARDAELAHRHVERNGDAGERLPWRQVQLGRQPARTIAFRRLRPRSTRASVRRRRAARENRSRPRRRTTRSGARAASPARVSLRVRRHEGESNSSASTQVR